MPTAALVTSVYALGVLTIVSFIIFAILMFRYLAAAPAAAPPAQKPGLKDEQQAFNIAKTMEEATKLLNALNKAKPVAIAALVTIFFLLAWLFVLSLLVSAQVPH